LPGGKDVFDVQGATAQVLDIEPQVVRGGCRGSRVTQDRRDHRRGRVSLEHRDRQRAADDEPNAVNG
jgi:hypothetical protein